LRLKFLSILCEGRVHIYTHKSPNQSQELGQESTKKAILNKYNQDIITQYPNGY